jgi:hypothetical protein
VVGPLLRKLFEVDVLDPLPKDGNPVLGELEEHDVAGIKMNAHPIVLKAVHEGVYLGRRHQVAIEEDVFDVEGDAQPSGRRDKLGDGLSGPLVADIAKAPRSLHHLNRRRTSAFGSR